MIKLEDIRDQIRGGETETLEFKTSTSQKRDAGESLCAMLNSRGGRVIFGVTPDGRAPGQQMGKQTVEDVVQEIRHIDPPVFPSIDRVPVEDGRELIVVAVGGGQGRPYSFRNKAYKRVGNTNLEMSRDEYNGMLLERLHGEQRWENGRAVGWTIADLDATEVVRTVDEGVRRGRTEDPGTRDLDVLLRGLGLSRDGHLLGAAVVLFGKAERVEVDLPQCLLRVARFRGSDRSEFIDNRQFHGNVFRLLQLAERFLRDNLPVAGRIQPNLFERTDDPLYPPAALREALVNAFCHRDYGIGGGSVSIAIYDDRLEITSSGSLHFGLTAEALYGPHESLPWNPLMARVLYRRGIVESWGRGTTKIIELMELAGLPRAEIEEAGGCVTVRFRPGRYTPPERVPYQLIERQQTLLQFLAESPGGLGLRAILNGLPGLWNDMQLKRDLDLLRQLGLVETSGHARGARWFLAGDRKN